MKMNDTTTPSESSLAESEFATWMRMNRGTVEKREHYEVRPCKRVRGFMLGLPGIRWKLWFPTVTDAVNFAQRVGAIYAAECQIYNSSGQKIS